MLSVLEAIRRDVDLPSIQITEASVGTGSSGRRK
jgi:hypothetical protein